MAILNQILLMAILFSNAPYYKLSPDIVLAVAQVESQLNQFAIGKHKEIGLMQIHPVHFKVYGRQQLFDIKYNLTAGMELMQEAKKRCKHRVNNYWLVCYNRGIAKGSRVQYPWQDTYYKKVMRIYKHAYR